MIIDNFKQLKEKVNFAVFISLYTLTPKDILLYRSYARKYEIFVVPPLFIENNFLNLCLINPYGEIISISKGTHLNMTLFKDLKRGEDINVISTPFGKFFLCVDVDIYKPEVLRIATSMGAEVVISSQVLKREHYSKEMVLAGPWQEAQQNCIFVVNVTNIYSSIIGPCKATVDNSGFLSCGKKVISAELIAKDLQYAYTDFPIYKSFNYALYRNHGRELLS